ncbi:IS1 family transposase, partial [Desulfococcaceae bacterium HSG9]|nr:IS1 family transposase [Desulfococcaceae bacterium HSG9]
MICPACDNTNDIVKNGSCSSGKQKYFCKDCKKHFIVNPEDNKISDDTKKLIDDLLQEKIPSAGIVRVAKVSKRRMQNYANDKYE